MNKAFKPGAPHGILVDLGACLVQMEASKEWFARRVLPLSLDQLRWRPRPRGWSIAECLDHLNTTLALYLPKINEAICRGLREVRRLDGPSTLEPPESDALKCVEPPATIHICALPAAAPAAPVDPDRLVDRFHETRDRYSDSVRRATGLDLARILITQPIHPVIRSLGGSLASLAAHDRRHMWQAEQARKALGFPHSVRESRQGDAT